LNASTLLAAKKREKAQLNGVKMCSDGKVKKPGQGFKPTEIITQE